MSNTYKVGDKVEVRINGQWVEGTYKADLSIYSNMKATPHSVSYKLVNSSGSTTTSDENVRPLTGTVVTVLLTPRVQPATVDLQALQNAIIVEINTMRANPNAYADRLAALKGRYKYVDNKYWYLDIPQEGDVYLGKSEEERADHERWLDETIAELKNSPALSQLTPNSQLRAGADYFASDTGPANGPTHTDSQGRSAQQRAALAGYTGGVNECIPGDYRTAVGTVGQLLIDWKVDSRGHRKNLMNKDIKHIGVACHCFPAKGDTADYIRTVIQGGYELS